MALQPHRLKFKPHKFEFILGIVLAMAMTILAMTTWAAPLEVMGWQMLVAFACGCLLGGAATIIVYSGDVTITRGVLDHLAKRHWKGTEANLTA